MNDFRTMTPKTMDASIPKPNVVDFNSKQMFQSETPVTPIERKRGLLKRILLSTNIMVTTRKGDGNIERDTWNTGMIAVIVVLIIVVVAGFLILLGIGAVFYLDMREDWRGTETWRQKQNYDEKRDSIEKCERAVMRQSGLIKIYEREKLTIPPEFLIVEPCGLQKSETNTNTGH